MQDMRLRRIGLGLAALALAAAACTGAPGDASASASPVPARNATQAELLPTDAAELPEFDADSYSTLLGQIRGTPAVVNIWASWCAPCRTEAPDLAAASAAHGSQVQFLGIDILDSRASARAFIREFGWTYPSLFDPTAGIRNDLGFIGQPDTIFIDSSGRTAMTWQGPLTPAALQKGLAKILPESSG